MKKLFVPALALAITAMYACGGTKPAATTPEEAVSAFFTKIQSLDFKGAKNYATKESAAFLDMMEVAINAAKQMGKGDVSSKIDEIKNAKFEVGTAQVNGDEAIVPVISKKGTKNVTVKKQGGSWKVVFDMSTMRNDNDDNIKDDIKDDMDKINNTGDSLDKVMDSPEMKKMMEELKDPKNMEKMKEFQKEMKKELENIKEN